MREYLVKGLHKAWSCLKVVCFLVGALTLLAQGNRYASSLLEQSAAERMESMTAVLKTLKQGEYFTIREDAQDPGSCFHFAGYDVDADPLILTVYIEQDVFPGTIFSAEPYDSYSSVRFSRGCTPQEWARLKREKAEEENFRRSLRVPPRPPQQKNAI